MVQVLAEIFRCKRKRRKILFFILSSALLARAARLGGKAERRSPHVLLGAVFGRDRLTDIRSKLGPAQVHLAAPFAQICYLVRAGEGWLKISFLSYSEALDLPFIQAKAFQVEKEDAPGCFELIRSTDVCLDHLLRIGLSKSTVESGPGCQDHFPSPIS
jgi:hypothetical protein